jgi:hypothetical protein
MQESTTNQPPTTNPILRFVRGTGQIDYTLTRWVYFRALGFIYFFAFAALVPQTLGLIGSNGIVPAATIY